jgi:hypothetical protein
LITLLTALRKELKPIKILPKNTFFTSPYGIAILRSVMKKSEVLELLLPSLTAPRTPAASESGRKHSSSMVFPKIVESPLSAPVKCVYIRTSLFSLFIGYLRYYNYSLLEFQFVPRQSARKLAHKRGQVSEKSSISRQNFKLSETENTSR